MRAVAISFLLAAAGCNGDSAAGGGEGEDLGGVSVPPDAATPPDLLHLDFGPPTGVVDPAGKGGTVNLLAFTAFGDIRPAVPNLDFSYPDATVKSVMKGMAALTPEFAVATGDYMNVELIANSVTNQLKSLVADEAMFTAPIFHCMGNHECQTFSDVNCPKLNETPNLKQFMSTLLPWTPVPWYSFIVHTALGDAKFIFIAVNGWTPEQAKWLEATLDVPTRYTFVVRHHPTPSVGAPSKAEGVTASDPMLAKHKITLFLFGHTHEYNHIAPNAVISGNAGAPLDAGHYGYLYVLQRPDGNVSVTEYQEGSNSPIDTWAVTPEGDAAP